MSFVRMLILWRSLAKFNNDAALLLKLLLIRLLNDFIPHKEANPMTNGGSIFRSIELLFDLYTAKEKHVLLKIQLSDQPLLKGCNWKLMVIKLANARRNQRISPLQKINILPVFKSDLSRFSFFNQSFFAYLFNCHHFHLKCVLWKAKIRWLVYIINNCCGHQYAESMRFLSKSLAQL